MLTRSIIRQQNVMLAFSSRILYLFLDRLGQSQRLLGLVAERLGLRAVAGFVRGGGGRGQSVASLAQCTAAAKVMTRRRRDEARSQKPW